MEKEEMIKEVEPNDKEQQPETEKSTEKECAKDSSGVTSDDSKVEITKKTKSKKGLLIGGIVGGAVLLVGLIIGVILFVNGKKENADSVSHITVSDNAVQADITEEKPLYYIENIPVIDINAQNYTPGVRTEGLAWDKTLFYWLEDVSATDHTDGNINNCVIYKTYMRDADTGNILQYEVYADASTGQIYKIVSIEQLEGKLRIIDYYYDNGKPNFIFVREDSVYTPTYATIGKIGNRYYFNNDVMVRWRIISTPNIITEYALTLSDVEYTQYEYSTLPADQQNLYDNTEIEMLNAAYNTYNAVMNTEAVGMVEGRLVDTTGAPLNNMTVKIYSETDDVLLYQTVTDAEGYFQIYVYLDNKKCYLVVEQTDIYRIHVTYNIYLRSNSYGYSCNDVVMHKIDGDEYPVFIDLYSALEISAGAEGSVTGALLQGATVSIREGANAYEGDVIKVLEADAGGRLTTNLPSGVYTAQVQMAGYAESYIEVIVNESETVVNGYLLPIPNQGETGIVLTWSGADVDLDLTLFTPYQSTGGDMAHIGGNVTNDAYGNRLVSDNNAYCEVMYVNTADVGNYKLFVNNYTDSMAGNYNSTVLAEVNIYIYIYDSNGFVTIYTFPLNQAGVVWEVVEINGTNLIPVHRVYNQLDGKVWWVESKEVGRLVKEIIYWDVAGEWIPMSTTEYIYDSAGRVTQKDVDDEYYDEYHIYTYDGNGRIESVTYTIYFQEENVKYIDYYYYDQQGKLLYIDTYEGTRLNRRTEYSYDNEGRISGYHGYFSPSEGELVATFDTYLHYDANGNISREEAQSGWTTYYFYDSAGNRIRAVEGQWEDGITEYTEYIYEDAVGNIINTDDWIGAYIDVIVDFDATDMEYNELKFDFVYLDDDDIPELVVDEWGNWVGVYTYIDGQVHKILDDEYGPYTVHYDYSPKTGILYMYYYSTLGKIDCISYYKLNGEYAMEEVYIVETHYYEDQNGNLLWDDGEGFDTPEIWYDGRQISQEEYNALPYSNYIFEEINGKMTALEAIEALQGM